MYLGHLWVAEVLVDDDSFDEGRLLQLPPDLTLHLDKLKVNVFPLHVRHTQDGLHRYLCHLTLTTIDARRMGRKESVGGRERKRVSKRTISISEIITLCYVTVCSVPESQFALAIKC